MPKKTTKTKTAPQPKPWSKEGRQRAAVTRVQAAIAEGKMAASMRLPPAPQLEISRALIPQVDWYV